MIKFFKKPIVGKKRRKVTWKTMSAHFSSEEYDKILQVCKKEGLTPYSLTKKAIEAYIRWLEERQKQQHYRQSA